MTVICYRDGVMAADSGAFDNDVFVGERCKITVGPDGTLAGAAGRCGVTQRFADWILGGMSGAFDPADSDFAALIVGRDGFCWGMDDKGRRMDIIADFHSEGAGRHIALGAMAAGATAEEAVRIAIDHHVYCRGSIQVRRI